MADLTELNDAAGAEIEDCSEKLPKCYISTRLQGTPVPYLSVQIQTICKATGSITQEHEVQPMYRMRLA